MGRVHLIGGLIAVHIFQCLSQDPIEVDGGLGDGWIVVHDTAEWIKAVKSTETGRCCTDCKATHPDTEIFSFDKNTRFCSCYKRIAGKLPQTVNMEGVRSGTCSPISIDSSFAEILQYSVDFLNGTRWKYLLPEDSDIDKDGNLSSLEVQHKFNTDIGKLFRVIDYDKDDSIVLQEVRSLKLDIPALTQLVDVALENYPLRPLLLAADANGDDFYDENDFYMPGEISNEKDWEFLLHAPQTSVQLQGYNGEVWIGSDRIGEIGQDEGIVICKSLGFDGLERVVEPVPYQDSYEKAASCYENEARIEDCAIASPRLYPRNQGMGVKCLGQDSLPGPLRLLGGKDSSSGEIFFGDSAMTCLESSYAEENMKVICRQLGFPGVLMTTRSSDFIKIEVPNSRRLQNVLRCRGDEKNVTDCPLSNPRPCDHPWSRGVICMTDDKSEVEQSLDMMIRWYYDYFLIWELAGRFLFIADANDDGKVTLAEIATKGKKLLTKILEFLDQTLDGNISWRDFTSPRISISSIHDLTTEVFADITRGYAIAEIDLYNMKIAGQDMRKFWRNSLTILDQNNDEKLTAADFFSGSVNDKATFLLPKLSLHLDKNQDGKIQREELRQITDEVFEQLDLVKDGFLTLEDAYSAMRKYGFDCLQVGALRSFITVWLDTIETQTANFFEYVFKQYDLDGNDAITQKELEKMGFPCYFKEIIPGRVNCQQIMETFFGAFSSVFERSLKFPDLDINFRRPSFGRSEPNEIPKETIDEKMKNAACEVLSDYLK